MRILIENYRGWEIYFDTENEEFYTSSNQHDTDKVKKSYATTKKFIDDYIKENSEFKPIKVCQFPNHYRDYKEITLIGIRKDGDFMYEDDGQKCRLSSYNEKEYFLVNEANEPIMEQVNLINKQILELEQKVKELEATYIKVDVRQLKKELFNRQ